MREWSRLRPLRTAEFINGPDGLEGAALPAPKVAAHDQHAVAFLLVIAAVALIRGDGPKENGNKEDEKAARVEKQP